MSAAGVEFKCWWPRQGCEHAKEVAHRTDAYTTDQDSGVGRAPGRSESVYMPLIKSIGRTTMECAARQIVKFREWLAV